MKNLITGLLIGLFAALWWTEREKNQGRGAVGAAVGDGGVGVGAVGKSRTLDEISPTVAGNVHPRKDIVAVPRDNLYTFADGVTKELVRPGLTELEAKNVADYLRETILSATSYYDYRKNMQENLNDRWIGDAFDLGVGDDDDGGMS